jgi:hypothetical protein
VPERRGSGHKQAKRRTRQTKTDSGGEIQYSLLRRASIPRDIVPKHFGERIPYQKNICKDYLFIQNTYFLL